MSCHLSGAPLKGVKEKQGKVPHLPPTEPQKRQHERHHLQMYPPETGFIPLKNTPSQIMELSENCVGVQK